MNLHARVQIFRDITQQTDKIIRQPKNLEV